MGNPDTERRQAQFSVDTAEKIARRAHAGQLDKAFKPYIEHPLRVMGRLQGDEAQMTGVLHDVVEDTRRKDNEVTFEDLEARGCPTMVIEALKLLTHPPDYQGTEEEKYLKYMQYVQAIADSGNQLAIDVKYADLEDNMNRSRIADPTGKDLRRLAKYKLAAQTLEPRVSEYLKDNS